MKIKDQLVKLFSSPVLTLTCRLVPEASNFINSVSRSCLFRLQDKYKEHNKTGRINPQHCRVECNVTLRRYSSVFDHYESINQKLSCECATQIICINSN